MRRLLLLAFLSFAAAAETPLGVSVQGPAPEVQYGSALASDGDGYLAVWTDKRTRGFELRAARVSAEGEVVDPTGIHLFTGDTQDRLAIWTGTSYLVVWGRRTDSMLWGARVSREGVVIDGPRVLVRNASPYSLARNGSHVVVGYSIGNAERELRALFLTPDGEAAADVLLVRDGRAHHGPRIAWNGSHFAALWTSFEPNVIEGLRFTIVGAVDAPRQLVRDGFAFDPELASDGTDFVLASRKDWLAGLHAVRRVSGDLSTVGEATVLPEAFYANVTIAWTGSHYAVVGDFGARVSGARIDREGRLLDAEPVAIETPVPAGVEAAPAIAGNGRGVLVTWSGAFQWTPAQAVEIYATELDAATLARGSRMLLSVSAPRESAPLIVAGRSNVLAVWKDDGGLLARRLRRDGSLLDAEPIRLTDKDVVPAVVFNGTNYLVAWREGMLFLTRRIAHHGELRAEAGTLTHGGDWNIAAASDGTTTLLVWAGGGVHAARLGPDGSILDRLTITHTTAGHVDVAANDRGELLVTWGEVQASDEARLPLRVRGARITSGFVNLDGAGFDIADTPALEGEPAVTWNGREWFVVWTEDRTRVRGRRVAPNGTLDGPDELLALNASRPDVVWDGHRYVLSWLAPAALHVGSRVLGTPEPWPTSPSLAVVGPGEVMAAYARISRAPEHGGVARAFVEVLRPTPRRRTVRF